MFVVTWISMHKTAVVDGFTLPTFSVLEGRRTIVDEEF